MVFHVRWIFLTTNLGEGLRRGWDSETSVEKSISHGKPYKMHFLAYFTFQGTLIMLNILRKVEYHENHVRWIYLTTVLYMGESKKYARIQNLTFGLPHQCPLALFKPHTNNGGRRSPAIACWASDHWVASSNPLRGKFRH